MTRYEVGFMNKCAEYGLDVETSVQLMKEAISADDVRFKALKAQNPDITEDDVYEEQLPLAKALKLKKDMDPDRFRKRRRKLGILLSALAGAGAGVRGGVGVAVAKGHNRGKALRDVLIGAGVGGLAGTGLGRLAMNTRDYLGIDPMVRTVATAK